MNEVDGPQRLFRQWLAHQEDDDRQGRPSERW